MTVQTFAADDAVMLLQATSSLLPSLNVHEVVLYSLGNHKFMCGRNFQPVRTHLYLNSCQLESIHIFPLTLKNLLYVHSEHNLILLVKL